MIYLCNVIYVFYLNLTFFRFYAYGQAGLKAGSEVQSGVGGRWSGVVWVRPRGQEEVSFLLQMVRVERKERSKLKTKTLPYYSNMSPEYSIYCYYLQQTTLCNYRSSLQPSEYSCNLIWSPDKKDAPPITLASARSEYGLAFCIV